MRRISMELQKESTEIQEFYKATNVLITGGTGFMGKVLMEKLLRACPHITTVYLLVRPKKGKDIEARLDDIFDDPLYGKLKEEQPKFRHKIVPISGDCAAPGLGLSPSDRSILADNVHIIFHGAATVRFDEKLKLAMNINVRGTEHILELARDMPNLKALLHISTAYCNCHIEEIEEKFCTYEISHEKLANVVDSLTENTLENITPFLLGKWPNTYAFTKAIAEDLIHSKGPGLPVGVFRPAIVIGTREEPVKGWIDNVYGPTGVFVGAGVGLLKTLHGDPDKVANLVPVDMAVNALIAAAWEVGNKPRSQVAEDIPVYNYISSVQKPLKWREFMALTQEHGIKVPTMRAIWYYSFTLNRYKAIHLLYVAVLHFLPALLVDSIALLVGKQPKLSKVYKKINRFSDVISYFSTREWKFTNKNVQNLWMRISEADRKLFNFDISTLDWDEYFYDYVRGCRVFLLKDDMSTLPQAMTRWHRFYWMHQAVKAVTLLVFLKIIWSLVSWGMTTLSVEL